MDPPPGVWVLGTGPWHRRLAGKRAFLGIFFTSVHRPRLARAWVSGCFRIILPFTGLDYSRLCQRQQDISARPQALRLHFMYAAPHPLFLLFGPCCLEGHLNGCGHGQIATPGPSKLPIQDGRAGAGQCGLRPPPPASTFARRGGIYLRLTTQEL